MRILVSGSTGFLGTAAIRSAGARRPHHCAAGAAANVEKKAAGSAEQTVGWDPVAAKFDSAAAEGADALVHLAGASIAGGRWNARRKNLLRTSRIDATRHSDRSAGEIAAAAARDRGGIGDRLLRQPRRRSSDGIERSGERFSCGALPGVGKGDGARGGIRRARGELAVRDCFGGARRRAAANDGAVQAGRGRATGQGPAMDVLGDAGRYVRAIEFAL